MVNSFSTRASLVAQGILAKVLEFGWEVVKNPPANSGVTDLIPGLGRSSAEGKGNPLQYSSLVNPVDTGTWHWQAISPCGHRELAMTETTEHSTSRSSQIWSKKGKLINYTPSKFKTSILWEFLIKQRKHTGRKQFQATNLTKECYLEYIRNPQNSTVQKANNTKKHGQKM